MGLCILACAFPSLTLGQSQQTPQGGDAQSPPRRQGAAAPAGTPQADQQSPATVAGTITDPTGALIPGARVVLRQGEGSTPQETTSDGYGQFYFLKVPPGSFRLSISAPSFETQVVSGTVQAGQHYVAPQIELAIAPNITQVTVTLTQEQIAEEQVKLEETQRVFGVIPNYFVSYNPNAAPLRAKQKFELAWKSTFDPFTVVAVGAVAGMEQAANQYKGYGQGAQGYGKRYGAAYADVLVGTFVGSAILPSLLKQDPRYYYKGTGTTRSRLLYAMSAAFITKGDNGKWQPNYSNVLGSFAAGGISNLYYPQGDRGAGHVAATALTRIGETVAAGVFEELVLRRFTKNADKPDPPNP